jgi:hypothetical protein
MKRLKDIIETELFDWSPSSGSREKRIGGTTITYGVGKHRNTELSLIQTDPKMKGKGEADNAMKAFTGEADKHKHTINLTAASVYKGTDINKLKNFYYKHGFVDTGTENNGWKTYYKMKRNPR